MVMHARDVAARLEGSGVTINCLNPGYIRSALMRDTKGLERVFVTLFGRLAAPAWVGGERIVAAALDRRYDGVSGKYIYEDMLHAPNPEALDDAKVARLLRISREMTGLAVPRP